MTDKKTACPHSRYKHDTKVLTLNLDPVAPRQLVLRIRVSCNACGEPFLFEGPVGFSTHSPSVSPDMRELFVPMHWPLREDDTDVEKDVPIQ